MKEIEHCSPNFKNFFKWTQEYLEEHGKEMILADAPQVKYSIGDTYCAGWCDGETIAAATQHHLFEETYAHEFSHMQQAVEGDPCWAADDNGFFEKLDANLIDVGDWSKVMEVLDLERNCEARTLVHSEKWGLFDAKQYARLANVYLVFYQYTFLKRKWIPSTTIYKPSIVNAMPDELIPLDNFKVIDMDMMMLYERELN